MKKYFDKFGYSNATLKDLITTFEECSYLDLAEWTNEWIKTAGLNTVIAERAYPPVVEKPIDQLTNDERVKEFFKLNLLLRQVGNF